MTISEILTILREEPNTFVYAKIATFDYDGRPNGTFVRLARKTVYDTLRSLEPDSTVTAIYYSGLKELQLF